MKKNHLMRGVAIITCRNEYCRVVDSVIIKYLILNSIFVVFAFLLEIMEHERESECNSHAVLVTDSQRIFVHSH